MAPRAAEDARLHAAVVSVGARAAAVVGRRAEGAARDSLVGGGGGAHLPLDRAGAVGARRLPLGVVRGVESLFTWRPSRRRSCACSRRSPTCRTTRTRTRRPPSAIKPAPCCCARRGRSTPARRSRLITAAARTPNCSRRTALRSPTRRTRRSSRARAGRGRRARRAQGAHPARGQHHRAVRAVAPRAAHRLRPAARAAHFERHGRRLPHYAKAFHGEPLSDDGEARWRELLRARVEGLLAAAESATTGADDEALMEALPERKGRVGRAGDAPRREAAVARRAGGVGEGARGGCGITFLRMSRVLAAAAASNSSRERFCPRLHQEKKRQIT